jgi:GMP synthase (glutamine-hydrolysing)
MQDTILIFDFGSQYTQLIARRIRELNVYCEIHPFTSLEKFNASVFEDNHSVKGVILSGSPCSVNDPEAPTPHLNHIQNQFPILGICYGAQLLAHSHGGKVQPSNTREYGRAHLEVKNQTHPLFKNIPLNTQVWMSHGDTITMLPSNFKIIASTHDVPVGAFEIENEFTFVKSLIITSIIFIHIYFEIIKDSVSFALAIESFLKSASDTISPISDLLYLIKFRLLNNFLYIP